MMLRGHLRAGITANAVVIIPAYNASVTIVETLEALQANPDLYRIKAVIVLDDASRDGTIEAAKAAWRSPVPFEVWSNQTNLGERITTNSCIARLPAGIEWVFILHADDVVNPNWLSLYLNEMAECPDDVATVCSSYDTWYSDSGRIDPGEEYPGRRTVLVQGTRDAVRDTLNSGCWWHISGCAIRILAFRQIGGFRPDMPQMGDWEWLVRCLAKGFSVLYLPRSTMRYRQQTTSVSSTSFRQAQDIRERLWVFAACRDKDYLTLVEYQQKIRAALYDLSRRALVRAARLDFVGMRRHVYLLAETSAKYFLNHI